MDPLTKDEVKEIVAAALGAAVAPITESLKTLSAGHADLVKNQNVIADTLAKLPPAAGKNEPEKKDDAVKAITAGDVTKIVTDALKAHQTTAAANDARRGFIAEKMKDLPAVYQNQLGNDAAKFAEEEQKIRAQYQADFKVTGGTTPVVKGDANGAGGGAAPSGVVDLSKLSPVQKISLGLKSLGDPTTPDKAQIGGAGNTQAGATAAGQAK